MYKLVLPALLVTACRNECQDLCVQMSEYASEECGQTWSDDDVESCLAKYKEADDATLSACAEVAPRLREEWTCEDLEPYFDDSDDGTDTGGGESGGGTGESGSDTGT
jgi:hypothetical protein